MHFPCACVPTLHLNRHYAPLATRLAQEGFVVVMPTYHYYPEALAPQMVS